eukprot:5626429-Prymnesium_polylepis.1
MSERSHGARSGGPSRGIRFISAAPPAVLPRGLAPRHVASVRASWAQPGPGLGPAAGSEQRQLGLLNLQQVGIVLAHERVPPATVGGRAARVCIVGGVAVDAVPLEPRLLPIARHLRGRHRVVAHGRRRVACRRAVGHVRRAQRHYAAIGVARAMEHRLAVDHAILEDALSHSARERELLRDVGLVLQLADVAVGRHL